MDGFSALFTPLDKQYCLYFYWLSVIGFVFMVLAAVAFIIIGMTKKQGFENYLHMIYIILVNFIFYFQNRLLYSVCARGL